MNSLSIWAYIKFIFELRKQDHFVGDSPWPWLLWTGSYVVECVYLCLLHTPLVLIIVNSLYAVLSLIAFRIIFKGQIRGKRS